MPENQAQDNLAIIRAEAEKARQEGLKREAELPWTIVNTPRSLASRKKKHEEKVENDKLKGKK